MVAHRRLLERDHLNRHRNRGIEIIAPMRGCFQWWVEGQTLDLRPGEISVTLPWQEHGGQGGAFNVGELCWIIIELDWKQGDELHLDSWSQLPPQLIQQLGNKLSSATQPIAFKSDKGSDQLLEILKEIDEEKPHHSWRINRIIDDLFFDMHRSNLLDPDNHSGAPSLADQLNTLLSSTLHHPWTLEEISREMAQSPSWLNRGLREETGYSTMELVTLHRIEKGKSLLETSSFNITQISQKCGFNTSQYFSSVFRKWVGNSPLQFREEKTQAS
jgi:AraC-like DNA-binding protein